MRSLSKSSARQQAAIAAAASAGDQAGLGLGLRQRPLGVEHGLQPGAVAELVEQLLRREDRVEHG